jgi:hypothetical protein
VLPLAVTEEHWGAKLIIIHFYRSQEGQIEPITAEAGQAQTDEALGGRSQCAPAQCDIRRRPIKGKLRSGITPSEVDDCEIHLGFYGGNRLKNAADLKHNQKRTSVLPT